MNADNGQTPEITLTIQRDEVGRSFLTYDQSIFDKLNVPKLQVKLVNWDGQERNYPVFQQNAMQYGKYSDYMKHHGCACCSLTTVLAGMRRSKSKFMPQDTIEKMERVHLPWHEFEKNYEKSLQKQMPISLYGIHKILTVEGISNRYIGYFHRKEVVGILGRHLLSGNPVIFETSRVRYNGWMVTSINDRKYAGSYHTMVMLGIDPEGMVLFTDSATRDWAGDQQRIKRAPLTELIQYMFPQKHTEDKHVYFHKRIETGCFILVKTWEKEELLKRIDKF